MATQTQTQTKRQAAASKAAATRKRNAAKRDAKHECQSGRAERTRATALEQFSLCKRI